jgi:hypothetical protein
MTADSLINFFLTVAIPILLAVAGGVLAIRTLPAETNHRERFGWIAVFFFLGIVGLVLGFIQQVRTTAQEKTLATANHERDVRQEGEVRYTQGELDSINKVLGQVVLAGTSGTQNIAKTLLEGAVAASSRTSQVAGTIPNRYQLLSHADLKKESLTLVGDLRALAEHEKEEDEVMIDQVMKTYNKPEHDANVQNLIRVSMRLTDIYNNDYKVEAIMLRDEMMRRESVAVDPRTRANINSSYDYPTNPLGLQEVANDLESLARVIPDSPTRHPR